MSLVHFRPRRAGPEREIEEAVARNVAYLFPTNYAMWVAGSVPLGAGMPDLVVVACKPEVRSLARADLTSAEILAYLRVVRAAKFDTLYERIERPRRVIGRSLDDLMEAQAVSEANGTLALNSSWRDILADIVAIEAKVSKWQNAVSQAARNALFAHRSYIAVPTRVTVRVRGKPIFKQLGIGLLSACENGDVSVSRRPRRRVPRVWVYYYKLALILAASLEGQ